MFPVCRILPFSGIPYFSSAGIGLNFDDFNGKMNLRFGMMIFVFIQAICSRMCKSIEDVKRLFACLLHHTTRDAEQTVKGSNWEFWKFIDSLINIVLTFASEIRCMVTKLMKTITHQSSSFDIQHSRTFISDLTELKLISTSESEDGAVFLAPTQLGTAALGEFAFWLHSIPRTW